MFRENSLTIVGHDGDISKNDHSGKPPIQMADHCRPVSAGMLAGFAGLSDEFSPVSLQCVNSERDQVEMR
jgi:hypothetical protein